MTREEYLFHVVTEPFIGLVATEVMHRVVGTEDFLTLEEFDRFRRRLHMFASQESEIDTEMLLSSLQDIKWVETNDRMRAFARMQIIVRLTCGTVQNDILLLVVMRLEGDSRRIEWTSGTVRVQLPNNKVYEFKVREKFFRIDITEVVSEETETKGPRPGRRNA